MSGRGHGHVSEGDHGLLGRGYGCDHDAHGYDHDHDDHDRGDVDSAIGFHCDNDFFDLLY